MSSEWASFLHQCPVAVACTELSSAVGRNGLLFGWELCSHLDWATEDRFSTVTFLRSWHEPKPTLDDLWICFFHIYGSLLLPIFSLNPECCSNLQSFTICLIKVLNLNMVDFSAFPWWFFYLFGCLILHTGFCYVAQARLKFTSVLLPVPGLKPWAPTPGCRL